MATLMVNYAVKKDLKVKAWRTYGNNVCLEFSSLEGADVLLTFKEEQLYLVVDAIGEFKYGEEGEER